MSSNPNYNNNFFINNNINNSNTNNNPSGFVTHENLFHSNITYLPNFNFEIQNKFQSLQYPNSISGNNNNNNFLKSHKKDFNANQLYKEEKFKELMNNQKKLRFLQNYENKIKLNKNNNIGQNNNNEVFIDDYIKKIKEIHKDKNEYDNYVLENGFYNFSTCPFCREPALFFLEKVLCFNKCFITAVASNSFDENYTLDNFIEQYKNYYSNHLNCKADLITLYIDKESKIAEFLCSKCERDIFDI